MNTYSKYAPNVFLAKCEEKHEKGEIITVTTRHGKENESIVYNLVYEKNGFYFYSIIRADGFNTQERALKKAEKYRDWQDSANKRADEFYKKSNKDRDFLRLGEPIKIGHHSEKRHRKIIEQAQTNTTKWVTELNKASSYDSRIEFWEKKAEEINLSMPESLDFFAQMLEVATEYHAKMKKGEIPRQHSYSLTYAKKRVNELTKKVDLAKKLWS